MGFTNETRGLTIPGTAFTYLSEGAYGIIFVDKVAGRIIKVYKRRSEENHVRNVLKAEADAYGLAASSPEVSALVPGNFRLRAVEQVVDKNGHDMTSEFFPNLAFEIDFIRGQFKKIGIIGTAEASRVHQLFRAVGIHHTTDMSVTVSADGLIHKAIDFAVQEHELMHGE